MRVQRAFRPICLYVNLRTHKEENVQQYCKQGVVGKHLVNIARSRR